MAGTTDIASNTTGSSAVAKALKAPGSSAASIGAVVNKVTGRDFTLRNSRANSGPAMIIAGIATTIPYTSVVPMSAPNIGTIADGDGCGGRNPCVTDSD